MGADGRTGKPGIDGAPCDGAGCGNGFGNGNGKPGIPHGATGGGAGGCWASTSAGITSDIARSGPSSRKCRVAGFRPLRFMGSQRRR